MSLAECANKSEVIAKYQRHDRDSGSPEVQIALLTSRLEKLAGHFQDHPQDKHSRQGLLKIVSHRKGLLEYLKRKDVERYRQTLANLGLRK
ncbi:MAG: 30S ribosomal protein S15 [Deltaproteobacteria bacterium]|nr:30S ribosomal protein S15 [Deltaproteobacteria bacterium]